MTLKIPLSRPDLDESDIESVVGVLKGTHLSLGPTGPAFERAVASYVGSSHAISVNSGTSGLHLCVLSLGLQPGDEVITTPYSFVASTNCLLFQGVRPVFVDIDPATWNMDLSSIRGAVTRRTRAILPVHVFGRPVDMPEVLEIAREHGLLVIEDSCESLGSTVRGRMTGTFGEVGVYAFYPNKQMTTGEGGMIVTDRQDVADLCRSLRNQGREQSASPWEHERLGYNYRLSDIQAALGLSQLKRLEPFIERRQRVFDLYREALSPLRDVHLPAPLRDDQRASWFVYVVRLADSFSRADRDAVLAALRRRGVECRDYFQPIHLQPYMRRRFGYAEGSFPVVERIAARSFALPFHNRLGEEEIRRVADILGEALHTTARRA